MEENDVRSDPSPDTRLNRLIAFADDVLDACDALCIQPILDGSLSVRAYTRNPGITVRDIDLNCSEAKFPRLQHALKTNGKACELRNWHVL